MSKPVALAIVHGTGQKEENFADDIIEMLGDLFPAQLAHLPEAVRTEAELVIEPVYWAALPRQIEDEIWERVTAKGDLDHLEWRRFLFNVAGDTLAYQPSEGRRDLYLSVHRVIAEAFERLAERAGPEAPLCVAAHSMGTIVAHNYLYDMQHGPEAGSEDLHDTGELPRPATPLERAETLALFVTYGSPLAIWRLRFGDAYKAIHFPGDRVGELYPGLGPKWLNIYDADDLLGYPIANLTERYETLAADGYLEDRQRNVGSWFRSWNPLAHKGYFRDADSLEDLASFLAGIWQGAYGGDG